MKVEKINLYTDRKDVTLTTYILDDSPEMLNGKRRPAVLICPGGAYLGLSDREGEPVAMKFVSMGYHAFVLRYSVYGEGKNQDYDLTKPLPVKEHCQYPKPIQEIGMAMLIIRDHAEEWLVDMDKIALCGFSAGSHNVSMYANSWYTDTVAGHLGVDATLLKPAVTTKSQMKPDAAKWADLAGVWLEKRFALPIPEDMEAIAGGVL